MVQSRSTPKKLSTQTGISNSTPSSTPADEAESLKRKHNDEPANSRKGSVQSRLEVTRAGKLTATSRESVRTTMANRTSWTDKAIQKSRKAMASKVSESCTEKQQLTIKQKVAIIKCHAGSQGNRGESAAKLGQEFGVQACQIRRICTYNNTEKIKREFAMGVNAESCKMVRTDKHPELTKELLNWMEKMRTKFRTVKNFNQTLSGAVIQARARKLAKRMGIDWFQPNDGWLYCLLKKY